MIEGRDVDGRSQQQPDRPVESAELGEVAPGRDDLAGGIIDAHRQSMVGLAVDPLGEIEAEARERPGV